jgi:hypothetical protein
MSRPYIVIPKIVKQPTWGGDYILKLKNWHNLPEYKNEKIGQSFELSSTSRLATDIISSKDPYFSPDSPGISVGSVLPNGQKMSLLIKINQALGNSFQLHIKPGQVYKNWLPKPETWFFLENGNITLGLNDNTKIDDYKNTCLEIESFMKNLSKSVLNGEKKLEKARLEASDFIKNKNPWQFVNSYSINKGSIIDLSEGALHHSWEENRNENPLGNIVFEVQLDALDDVATIRSFDQGKIQDDGKIREIAIDDYFQVIDTDKKNNLLESHLKKADGIKIIRTKFYSVDRYEIFKENKITFKRDVGGEGAGSFHHFYVQSGEVSVYSNGNKTLNVSAGHSFFVPQDVLEYEIKSVNENSALIKSFLP